MSPFSNPATYSFESSGGHTFKIALFDSDATLGASTTDYSTSEEKYLSMSDIFKKKIEERNTNYLFIIQNEKSFHSEG